MRGIEKKKNVAQKSYRRPSITEKWRENDVPGLLRSRVGPRGLSKNSTKAMLILRVL